MKVGALSARVSGQRARAGRLSKPGRAPGVTDRHSIVIGANRGTAPICPGRPTPAPACFLSSRLKPASAYSGSVRRSPDTTISKFDQKSQRAANFTNRGWITVNGRRHTGPNAPFSSVTASELNAL
jgi:hypothetical protein